MSGTGWGEPGHGRGGKSRRGGKKEERGLRQHAVKSRQEEGNADGVTGAIRAEVEREDAVAEARDVLQLCQVSLQGAAGQSRFVERSHKAKHEGVQTGGPAQAAFPRSFE